MCYNNMCILLHNLQIEDAARQANAHEFIMSFEVCLGMLCPSDESN